MVAMPLALFINCPLVCQSFRVIPSIALALLSACRPLFTPTCDNLAISDPVKGDPCF